MAKEQEFKSGLLGWIDARFPLSSLWNEHMAQLLCAQEL